MENGNRLKDDLVFLGLYDKAREIYFELGGRSVLSYIKSSHRLLSKVYHPDLNPDRAEKAGMSQTRLNSISGLIESMSDDDILAIFRSEPERVEGVKKKILVVEDEFGLQETFRDIFLMEGYDVRVAVDGVDGLDAYRRFSPDLVFTDVVMPKMSGLELVRKIRETNPSIKVIYVSGFFGFRRLEGELLDDISRYGYLTLAKPFKASAMLQMVRQCLEI